ncbi:hypothetical protein V5799_000806 [Amblyomma americanum]|uniref:Uncharacterized protein n=1 Tax=Amblyomma americanum TaxID=6943 RepID=A0AAQ4D206_AMBAM
MTYNLGFATVKCDLVLAAGCESRRTIRNLVAQVICVLTASWLLTTSVSGVAVAVTNDSAPPGDIVVNATSVPLGPGHKDTGGSLATGEPSSSDPSSPRLHQTYILNKSSGASRSGVQRNVDSVPSLPKWCLTHVSSKFFKVRAFRSRTSVMGRAAVGTVFVATSLLVALSVFALAWCLCHSCKRNHKEIDPVLVLTPSSSSIAPKDISKNGDPSRPFDPPPSYDRCLQASAKEARPHETAASLQSAALEDAEQPPTYNAVVLSVTSQAGAEMKQQ